MGTLATNVSILAALVAALGFGGAQANWSGLHLVVVKLTGVGM